MGEAVSDPLKDGAQFFHQVLEFAVQDIHLVVDCLCHLIPIHERLSVRFECLEVCLPLSVFVSAYERLLAAIEWDRLDRGCRNGILSRLGQRLAVTSLPFGTRFRWLLHGALFGLMRLTHGLPPIAYTARI